MKERVYPQKKKYAERKKKGNGNVQEGKIKKKGRAVEERVREEKVKGGGKGVLRAPVRNEVLRLFASTAQ